MLGKCSNTELQSHNLTFFIQLKEVGAVSRPPPIVTDYWGSKLGMKNVTSGAFTGLVIVTSGL